MKFDEDWKPNGVYLDPKLARFQINSEFEDINWPI